MEGLLPLIALPVHLIIAMVKLFCVIVVLSNTATTDILLATKIEVVVLHITCIQYNN